MGFFFNLKMKPKITNLYSIIYKSWIQSAGIHISIIVEIKSRILFKASHNQSATKQLFKDVILWLKSGTANLNIWISLFLFISGYMNKNKLLFFIYIHTLEITRIITEKSVVRIREHMSVLRLKMFLQHV